MKNCKNRLLLKGLSPQTPNGFQRLGGNTQPPLTSHTAFVFTTSLHGDFV